MKATLETTPEKQPLYMYDLEPGDIAEILEQPFKGILVCMTPVRHAFQIGSNGAPWIEADKCTISVRRLTPGEKIVIS